MEKNKNDNFKEIQSYMKGKGLHNTRMAFKVRCEMLQDIKGNFKSKYRRKGGEEALICKDCDCGQVETQNHCLVCPQWEELNLVVFFQKMLLERSRIRVGSDRAAQQTPVPV